MMPVVPLLIALACAGVALVTAPTAPASQDSFPPPPPLAVTRAAALGRTEAATDVLWLLAVQRIGHPKADALEHPLLELWMDEITELSPRFELPYAYAAVLLSADAARIDRVDEMLQRGEQEMPGGYWFPLQRAYLAYFGRGDVDAAIGHYRRSAAAPKAPGYIAQFAARLESGKRDCASMQSDLRALTESTATMDAREAQKMFAQRRAVLENCVRLEWNKFASRFRLDNQREPTVDELVALGMAPLPTAPGLCWAIDPETKRPAIVPCPGVAP